VAAALVVGLPWTGALATTAGQQWALRVQTVVSF
jgi:hypothetical protein